MILSSARYEVHDRCPRRYALERTHEPRSISGLGLMYAGVEGGVVAPDPGEGAKDAVRAVTAVKDVDAGPLAAISAVRHVGLMAEVIALALRRKLGPMSQITIRAHWASTNGIPGCLRRGVRYYTDSSLSPTSTTMFSGASRTPGGP